MNEERQDETRCMSPDEVQNVQRRGASPEDTQSLPRIDAKDAIQQPFPRAERGVRELPPLRAEEIGETSPKRGFFGKRKKLLFLALGFVLAALLGFVIAGYRQDAAERQEDLRLRQEQLADREHKLDAQESDLQKRRQEAELQKKALEERQKELEREVGKLQGRAEALQEEKPSSALGKFFDKVSGKEGKREQAVAEMKEQGAANASEAASVHQSIADAQAVLGEIDKKIDAVQSMKQDVDRVKQQAQSAYEENRDVIDRVVDYAQRGAALLSTYLLKQ